MSKFAEHLKRMSEKAAEKKATPPLRETAITAEFAQALDSLSSMPFIGSVIKTSAGLKP